MTKFFTAALAAIVSSVAMAGTFVVPPNGEIRGNPDGTVSWSGVSLGSIVHFRDVNAPPVEHKVSGSSGSIKLQDVGSNGGRFQVRDTNGNWAWLTPSGTRFTLAGAHLDCGNHDGCALEVDGTGPKSAPVGNYPGGVYQGYQPAQQLASTTQSVGVNTTQMAVAPVGGAVVTPVAMVPPPTTVVGVTQSVSAAGKYKLVPVGLAASEAKKAGYKKPAVKVKAPATDKAPAVVKVEQCVPGKKFTMNGKEYLCAVLATEPVTPPVAPAATAPAAPPAATAPAAPVATAPAAPVAAPAAPAPAATAAKKG